MIRTTPLRENGILYLLSGDEVSAGSKSFPPPESSQPPERESTIKTERFGLVRIKFRLKRYRHHKTSTWDWAAWYAEQVQE